MNSNNYKGRWIDFSQYIIYVLEHIGIVLLVSVIFAGAFSVFGINKMNNAINKNAVYKQIIDKNKDANNPQAGVINYNTEKEVIEGSCVIKCQLYIDFNFNEIEQNENMDFNGIIARFQNDVINRMLSGDTMVAVSNQINLKEYDGLNKLNPDDLRYMVCWTIGGSNIISYSITDVDTERGMDIANALENILVNNLNSMNSIDSVDVLEVPAVSYNTTETEKGFSISGLLKYIIIGLIFGIIVAFGLYLILFIIKYTVRTKEDLVDYGMDSVGRISIKKEKKEVDCQRVAYNLSILENVTKILISPVDSYTDISDEYNLISSELKKINKDIDLLFSKNIVDSPEAILLAKKSDAVVLVATYSKTLMKSISYAKSEVEKTNKPILGVIITQCRH